MSIWAWMQENMSSGFGNNKGADQPEHTHILISTYDNPLSEIVILDLLKGNFNFWASFYSRGDWLSLALWETRKTGFVVSKPIYTPAEFAQAWKVLELRGLSWKVLENQICLEKYWKITQKPWKILEFYYFLYVLALLIETKISIKLLCLYSLAKGFTLSLQETRSIHDSMNLPEIEFIAYIYI